MKKEIKNLIWIIVVIFLVLTLLRFLIPLIFNWNLPHYSHMFSPMMFPIGMIGMFIFWGGILYIIYLLLKPNNTSKNENDILKQRLSRGEITIEEYNKIKKTLED